MPTKCEKCGDTGIAVFDEEYETSDGLASRYICKDCGGKPRLHDGHIATMISSALSEHLLSSLANLHISTEAGLVRIERTNYGIVATLCDDKGVKVKSYPVSVEARP
jgi:hypothetical protein